MSDRMSVGVDLPKKGAVSSFNLRN
jgi:hypothetical protein